MAIRDQLPQDQGSIATAPPSQCVLTLTKHAGVRFLQEHTNTIRRFQFVSLQEAAAYVAKVHTLGVIKSGRLTAPDAPNAEAASLET